MKNVTACIDGSTMSASICDTAVWASNKLHVPVKFLHVLEKTVAPVYDDLSGSIGLGSREMLLQELVEVEEKRGRLAIEHGKHLLEDAKTRARKNGANEVLTEQKHGFLLETLTDYENETRLFVIGRLGEGHDPAMRTVGSHVESVVRAIHTPVLVAVDRFDEPNSYMIAYDGSETADNAIERMASSPLLNNMQGHVVMVGSESAENVQRLEKAKSLLSAKGHNVHSHIRSGQVVETLEDFQKEFNISLKVMGAYGHSRFREFFLGSNTTRMIGSSAVPLLLLR